MDGRKLWALLVLIGALLPVQAQEVFYLHTDALGSVVAETDANRNVVERSEYEPYGKVLNRPVKNGPGYTGHVEDATTGLTYMQQRYYDPTLGRFLSVDPVTANSGTGANFNRYWYANNNPYRFTDPDGRLARGSGFTDKEWKTFDRAQQRAAGNLEKAAGKITRALETGRGLKGVTRAFERSFGKSSGTAGNMTKVACTVTISQVPGGQVKSAISGACALDESGRRALEAAALMAQPLPYQGFESVFREEIVLEFSSN